MGGIPTPAAAADLVERAVAKMVDETGLPVSTVRSMVRMEAARSPASLPFLAGGKAICGPCGGSGWMRFPDRDGIEPCARCNPGRAVPPHGSGP